MDEMQEGIVDSLDGRFARVRFAPHAGCSDCGACGGAGVTILAENGIGALIGDRVRLESSSRGQLSVALVLFILPLAAVFLGLGAGRLLASLLSLPSTLLSAVGALFFSALSLVCIVAYDRRARAGAAAPFRIISIAHPELED